MGLEPTISTSMANEKAALYTVHKKNWNDAFSNESNEVCLLAHINLTRPGLEPCTSRLFIYKEQSYLTSDKSMSLTVTLIKNAPMLNCVHALYVKPNLTPNNHAFLCNGPTSPLALCCVHIHRASKGVAYLFYNCLLMKKDLRNDRNDNRLSNLDYFKFLYFIKINWKVVKIW